MTYHFITSFIISCGHIRLEHKNMTKIEQGKMVQYPRSVITEIKTRIDRSFYILTEHPPNTPFEWTLKPTSKTPPEPEINTPKGSPQHLLAAGFGSKQEGKTRDIAADVLF